MGWPGGAPYDGIIATAGATDLAPAWVTQLASRGGWWCSCPSGAPSSAWPSPWQGGHLRSVAVCDCGFMPLTGVMPDTNRREPVPGHPGTYVHATVGTELDIGLVTAALDDPRRAARTGITAQAERVSEAWGAGWPSTSLGRSHPTSAPRTAPMPAAFRPCSSSSTQTSSWQSSPCILSPAGFAALDLAALVTPAADSGPNAMLDLAIRSYGDAGQQAIQLMNWSPPGMTQAARHRRLRIDACPAGSPPPTPRAACIPRGA